MRRKLKTKYSDIKQYKDNKQHNRLLCCIIILLIIGVFIAALKMFD